MERQTLGAISFIIVDIDPMEKRAGHRVTTLGLFVDEPQGEAPDAGAGRRARGIAPSSPLRPCGIGRRSRFSQA